MLLERVDAGGVPRQPPLTQGRGGQVPAHPRARSTAVHRRAAAAPRIYGVTDEADGDPAGEVTKVPRVTRRPEGRLLGGRSDRFAEGVYSRVDLRHRVLRADVELGRQVDEYAALEHLR